MIRLCFRFLLALSCFVLAAVPVLAAEPATVAAKAALEVPHLDGQAKIDGVLDEAFWQQANKFELAYETRPGENTPASVKTTVYIGENGENLLVAFVAEDPDPKQIRAYLRDRDSAFEDDFVGMNLDTFDDQRRSYEFYVNPLGAQMDLIYEEANSNEDPSWDGLWDAAGVINGRGYIVEIEIPFSTMRFKGGGDVQQWGADFVRFRPRADRFRLSNNIQDRNNRCYLCGVGKLRGFAGAQTGKNLEIAPTLTMSYSQQRDTPDAAFGSEGLKFDPGVDLKWGPTPNMTINATINPDFSQVEADSGQLDVNNTFALFFPEKRPFFLEGADYFSTPNQVVYTRNVTDPEIGLRVTGRSGKQTYGVFVASDTVTNLLIPGVNGSYLQRYDMASKDAALRYRYDLKGNSSIGVIATERQGDDYRNSVRGVDGRWQRAAHSLEVQYLTTSTQEPASEPGLPLPAGSDGNAYTAEYFYRTRNWNAFTGRQRFDDGFRADLGFIGQVGYEKLNAGLTRHWWGDKDKFFNHITLNARWSNDRASDGRLLQIARGSSIGANGPLQSYLEFGHVEREKEWNAMRFHEQINRVYGEFTPRRGLSMGLFMRHGDLVDLGNTRLAKITTVQPNFNLNIGRSLLLSVNHNHERLSRDGGDVYVADLTDLRLSWQFSLRQRLRMAVLRSDLKLDPSLFAHPEQIPERQRSINTQLIYSYKINPRTALYAGYADGYFGGHLDRGNEEFPEFVYQPVFQTDRTLFFKIGYAWER